MDIEAPMKRIQQAENRLDEWVEQQNYAGWDPHDALNSPLLKRLTFGNRRMGQLWVQLLKRSPLNFRHLLAIPKGYNPKGMGLFLSAFADAYRVSGDPEALQKARFFADWLLNNISPGYSGACWGYNFDWPNRGFYAPAGTPTVVNTAFIGLAFLDLNRALRCWGDESGKGLTIARSACDFVLKDLNRLQEDDQSICYSYTPLDQRYVHNASLLGARLLAEVFSQTQEEELAWSALNAARFTAKRQQQDGSWPYGVASQDAFVDNFHTGFVLTALKRIACALNTDEFDPVIDRGYAYWRKTFFLPDWQPRYYADRTYPIDIHCVAQGILTFLEFIDKDEMALESAINLALWGLQHFQDPQGYFYYQINPFYTNKIPYMRWSQAWMKLALTNLPNALLRR